MMGSKVNDLGRLADATGLSSAAPIEPVPVSPVPASIPSANGPQLWAAILADMPVGSVVAGGAVRDYLLGVDPKDIDVFIDITADAGTHDGRFGLHRIDNEYERFAEYAAVSDIVCVSSGTMFGHRVDAVVMENYKGGAALVEGFDFGINRCWFDGEIHDTAEAKSDRDEKCATLLLEDRIERSLARFERLNERWGGGWCLASMPAQAIEAGTAATGTGAVHESAVACDAPNPTPDPNTPHTKGDL